MQKLAYGETSQRIVCPHLGEAVPAADVTITIADDDGTELLASTTASKGTFSTTLTAGPSAGARSITVASVAGLAIDETIILTDDSGRTDLTQVEGFDGTALTVALRDRLSRSYAVGDTVKSAKVYYDLDASSPDTWAKDIYYVAVFDCASWLHARSVVFRIVDLGGVDSPITYEEVRRWLPHISTLRDSYDKDDLADARDNAWALLQSILRGAGRDPEVWRDVYDAGSVGGLLAAALFCVTHNMRDLAHELAGDPVGTGGVFRWYWEEFVKAARWFDTDQDRVRDRGETSHTRSFTVGRGL